MWAGFTWAGAAWASQPQYGGAHCPGIVFGGDGREMLVYGSDMAEADLVFGGDLAAGGRVFGEDGVRDGGYAYGGDSSAGKVVGGDERGDC